MAIRNWRQIRGFTLTEIIIVVVILGILAAIVIPQFTSASESARQTNLQSTLQTLRSQIQLYKIQHGEALPNLCASWNDLILSSSYGNQTYGPYLQSPLSNELNGSSKVIDRAVSPSAGFSAPAVNMACGFVYDYSGGKGSGVIYGTDSTGRKIAGAVSDGAFTPY